MMGSSLFYFVLVPTGVNDITATATTAVIIGLVGGLLGRRYQIPPLVISIAGITPLLPGSAIYRGLFGLLNEQILVGFSNLTYAFAAATALSAGVVFGEWIARRLRRPPSLAHYRKVAVRIMRARRRNVFD